jgi:hypothetical protein
MALQKLSNYHPALRGEKYFDGWSAFRAIGQSQVV